MLNSVGASTQPSLTPFLTGNGPEYSPSFWARASMPSWNYRTIAMILAGQPNFDVIFQSCVKCFGEADKGHVEVHNVLLAFLLELPYYTDHVYWSTVLSESLLTF